MPEKRIFWGALLSATLLGLFAFNFKLVKERLFNLKIWLHPSSRLDFKIYGLNILIKALIFAPIIPTIFFASATTLKFCHGVFGSSLKGIGTPYGAYAPLIYTIISFVWTDFLRFFQHWLFHSVPFMRPLHRVHHSAEVLTPISLYRAHPLEALVATIRNVFAMGIPLGLMLYLFPGKIVTGYDILGVNIFGFLFNHLGGNLRHSHIPLSFGPLEYVFISPRMHIVHHSKERRHWNKNYGVALSLWDHIFGSFYRPTKEEALSIEVGLDNAKHSESRTVLGALRCNQI